jgi:cysteinyl-tRNA synthetase
LNIIIEVRQKLREEKRFYLSDKIREDLKNLGIILEDKKEGTSYRIL